MGARIIFRRGSDGRGGHSVTAITDLEMLRRLAKHEAYDKYPAALRPERDDVMSEYGEARYVPPNEQESGITGIHIPAT